MKIPTIGADPEFIIHSPTHNRVLSANNNIHNDVADWGADGNGTTFELRPAPSHHPLQLVANTHDVFMRRIAANPKLLQHNWHSGSFFNYPLGGHIHFGVNKYKSINFYKVISMLDQNLGIISLLLEKPSNTYQRRKHGYGEMGDYRKEHRWGFEYRVCGSWLTSPHVAAAILCLAQTVIYEILLGKLQPDYELFQTDKFNLWVHDVISHRKEKEYTDTMQTLKSKFPTIWEKIIKMQLYPEYKKYIDLIHFIITNNLTWHTSKGMKEAWGLTHRLQPLETTSLDKIWANFR